MMTVLVTEIANAKNRLLKKEKFFFENSAGEYANLADKEKNKLLVERVESIVSAETSKYFTMHQPKKEVQQKT